MCCRWWQRKFSCADSQKIHTQFLQIYWISDPFIFIYISLEPLELKNMGSSVHFPIQKGAIRCRIYRKPFVFYPLGGGETTLESVFFGTSITLSYY